MPPSGKYSRMSKNVVLPSGFFYVFDANVSKSKQVHASWLWSCYNISCGWRKNKLFRQTALFWQEKWTLSLGMKCLHEPWTANRWLVSFSGQSTPPRRQKDWKLAKFISEMWKSVVLLWRVKSLVPGSYFSLWEATSIVFITFCCNLYFDCDTRSKQDKRPYCSGSSEPFKPLSFRKRKREKAFRSCQLV